MPEPTRSSWTDEYEIRSYETGAEGEATLTAVCRFFQESAWHHARSVKQWYDSLLERGCFWVLSRLTLRMSRFPRWGERIRVKTWSSGTDRLFALRDFLVHDDGGSLLGSARSAWLVVGEKTRRPQRIDLFFAGAPVTADERAFHELPEKLPPLENPLKGPSFPVRHSDLDVQNHVNNAKYIEWCLDSFPPSLHASHSPRFFSINFLAECSYGDTVFLLTETTPVEPQSESAGDEPPRGGTGGDESPRGGSGEAENLRGVQPSSGAVREIGAAPALDCRISMAREADGREICRAKIVWRKRE